MSVSAPVPVGVHWADPAGAYDELRGLLDDHELDKHGRFVRAADRDRYLVAHALVRLVLAERLRTRPETLVFDRTCARCGAQHGKPSVVDADVQFSLSHSGDRVVVAVCEGHQVGVDVETVGSANGLATELLDPWELDRLTDGTARDEELTVWWARKEALLKATGDGLSVDPRTVRVSPPGDAPELLSWPGAHDASIVLHDLRAGSGHRAAVAVVTTAALDVTEQDAEAVLAGYFATRENS